MQKHPEDSTNKLTTTSLVAHLARVPDPRINRNKDHDLVDILVIAVCALLCAAETFNDMEDFGKAKRAWFQTFLKLRGGIPRYYQSDALAWFADKGKWEGLKSVGLVESVRELKGKTTVERRYFLSSLPLGVETFARAVRGRWCVENKLHWVLDVCLREDQSRARTGYAAENLAALRRLALNMLKREKTKKRGIRGKQLNASWDHPYLLRLLGI